MEQYKSNSHKSREAQNQPEKKVDKVVSKKKSTKKKDNKEKVAKILQDEHTSIKEDELDLVIDELFDDLFGE